VQSEYVWEFTIDSNLDGPAELQWDNSGFGNNNKDLFLLDVQTQTLVNMREATRFTFNPGESGRFKLFFGTNLKSKIMPNKVVLGKAYPNPTTGMTTIPFSLPDQAAGYQVSLEVYDNMGRKINTIINDTFNSGFYNSEWDASLGGLSNGIYTYRLAVSSSNGSEVQSGKIMIRK
jgi:Secretion system C-terminal sorting domain